MKIFDCTTYFNEPLIMDVRFNILDKYVDKFVIVESVYSHSGTKKEINFDINLYPKFKDKIQHVIIDKEPNNIINEVTDNREIVKRANSIVRIEHQRNEALKVCNSASGEDCILYSDNDEIPNLDKLDINKIKSKFFVFEQKLFHYKFNLLNDRIFWYGTKGAKKKNIKSISELRNIKPKQYSFYRIDTFLSKSKFIDLKIIKNGGWHFSHLKNPKDLYEKFKNDENYSEFDNLNINADNVRNMIDNKIIEYDHLADSNSNFKHKHKFKLRPVDIKSNMPIYLIENLDYYKDWFDFDFKNI